jgi:hypothetical protein
MFVICDSNGVVQDIASEQANLSRGLTFDNYVLYSNVTISDIRIGDTFDGTTLTPNATTRAANATQITQEGIIQQHIRQLGIAAAIADSSLPTEFIDFYDL